MALQFDPKTARPADKPDFEFDAGTAKPADGRSVGDVARDVAATAVKGAIAVPEAVVGLADIPTGGRVGKFLENEGGAFGFRPKQAREIVNEWHSDATKEAQRKFQEADGIGAKFQTAIENPSLIATAVGESLPSIVAGGVVARGLMGATRLGQMGAKGAAAAGAIGEGTTMAGSAAEQIRQETPDGLLTPAQAGAAMATGAAGAAFGYGGGRLAQRLGIGDADTMLAQGAKGLDKQMAQDAARAAANPLVAKELAKGIPRQVIEGAISEGLFEELPQSVTEQVLQNLALGKDWHEDVDAAVVMGVLSGNAMGGAAAGYHGLRQPKASAEDVERANQPVNPGQPPADQPPPNPGLERVRQALADQLAALQTQEQVEPDVPQTTPPDGAAVLARQRAAQEAERQAALAASRALPEPDDEIYQSIGADVPRSVQMGLSPDAGGLESAAALAVDTGLTDQLQQQAAQAKAAEEAEKQGRKRPKTPSQDQKEEQRGPVQQGVDPDTGEILPPDSMASWSDQQLSQAFRSAQARDVRLALAQELARRRAQTAQATEQEAAHATAATPEASTAAPTVPGARTSPMEATGGNTIPTTEGDSLARQAQTVQAGPLQPQAGDQAPAARAAAAEASAVPAAAAPAGGGGLQAAGLTNGAQAQNPGAQAAAAPGAQAAPAAETRAQRVASAGEAWTRMPAVERQALAQRANLKPIVQKNVHRTAWESLNGDIQRKLADAITPTPTKTGQVFPTRDAAMQEGERIGGSYTVEPINGAGRLGPHRLVIQRKQADAMAPAAAPAIAQLEPVDSLHNPGKPDPKNSAAMDELDGFKPGDTVDVNGRTIGRSTVELVFRRQMAGLSVQPMARVVGANGKKLDVLLSDLTRVEAAAELTLDDQLKQVNDQLANQGMVQNANTRAKRDQIRTAIAERDFPAILKAVDGDVGSAEAINQALQFAGDEPKAKVIERVLKNRGISAEYRKRWAERLMGDAGAQGAAPTPSPGVVNIPPVVSEALENDLRKQKARAARLRTAAAADGTTLDEKRAAQLKVTAAEATLRQMRTKIFDAEDAVVASVKAGNPGPFSNYADLFPGAEQALVQHLLATPAEPIDVQQVVRGAVSVQKLSKADTDAAAEILKDKEPAAAPAKPAPKKKPSADQTRAKADLMAALADLGDILGKNTRMNIVPEQEQKLLPVLTRVLDAAFRLGYHKFKDSAKFALDQIREHLGADAADALTLDHLQGAYIAMAGGKQGADTKRAVIDVESKAEIEAHEAAIATEKAETDNDTNAPGADATTKEPNSATTVPTGELPAERQERAGDDAATGNRNSEPLDDGLAGSRQGADRGERVPAGTAGAGGSRADGVQQSGQSAPGTARDSGTLRSEQQPADPVADPATAETSPKPELDQPADFNLAGEDIGKGGLTKKYRDNIAAIRILKAMESENRVATPEERKQIARYVGWGALKGVFDPQNKQWSKEYAELKELLTDAEYKAARASTLNAHYTSPTVVGGIFEALDRLGFTKGRVLEPSVGTGNFFGLMPAKVRKASQLHGVELDPLTSQIAAALYPSAKIAKATGFQDFQVPAEYFDLAIGNPPFGSEPLVDDDRSPYSGASIHNYFFAKSIDKLRPGGLLAMVVSHNFLDAKNDTTRRWIAERANLVSAVRLPRTAFKENAGTDVVTDILIFQKKTESERVNGLGDASWVNTTEVRLTNPKTGEESTHRISSYFEQNPSNVLGTPTAGGSMYRANEYTVEPLERSLEDSLTGWVNGLPQGIYQAVERTHEPEAADVAVPDGIKVGSYFVANDGSVQIRGNDVMGNRTASAWTAPNAKAAERMKGMIGLRDALRAQMRLEKSPDATEDQIEAHRRDLNAKYDAFQKSYGYLNDPTNRRIFLDDTESALLLALEFDYDKGVSKAVAEKEDIEARAPSAVKADIFKRRVMFPPADNIKVSNAKDALLASLNYKGRLDLDYMASLYDKPQADIVSELGDVVFNDPINGMVMSDEYLSGDVKTKLAEAEAAARDNPVYKRNVDALKKVIPADKRPSEIHAALGAPFIPAELFEQFAKEVTGATVKMAYIKATGQWIVDQRSEANATLNVGKWGIGKMPATTILSRTMAGQGVVVTETHRNPDGSTTTVVLERETEAAREKQAAMKAEWQRWLWADADRADMVAGIYNEKMNRIVPRQYDGSHMTFPGMSPAIQLLSHQKNAVWRGLQSRQVLLDHVVGAGKTFEVVTLFMEMRRLGIARKPFIAVPNHLTLQWRSEFSRLYPAANVLAATPDDFSKGNREKFFSKIITGDWDAVIVGHSSLKKIALPAETEKAVLEEQITEIASAIEDMKRARGDRNIIRDMEGIKARLEARMKQRLQALGERDKVVTFDELGVDAFAIDELHEFKNLFYNSTMERVPGMGNPAGSDKAFDLFVKLQWMFDTFGDKAPIIGATGTPVSNSLVEMFNMQRFLQYPMLKREGLHVFDAWAKQFGSVESLYEVSPSGTGYRQSSRFAKFKNLPALMAHYQTFADTVTLDDLKAQEEAKGNRFPVPKVAGGRPVNVVAKRSPQVASFMGVPELDMKDGAVQFGFNVARGDEAIIEQNSDRTAWTVQVRSTNEDGQPITAHLGSAKTEEDARLMLVEAALSPKIKVDPESILGKFGRLRELNKETKGKVNALSLTGQANKAGLDYRLIDPSAPDFAGSKINLAVDRMMSIYHQWAADKGTQLVFCDLSVPLSSRSGFGAKERRIYVRDNGAITHKRGTMHTVAGHEDLPFFLVKEGAKDAKSFAIYDAATGLRVHSGLPAKAVAIEWAGRILADDAKRQRWIDARDNLGDITQDEIDDYNNANEIDTEETEAISLADIAGVSGATGFSVYDDIKAKLIAKGVPEREIAFIHDYGTPAAKDKLFKAVNNGSIRFLLGSTPKMGAGTNVQKRLVGLHHIDAPWRPSDLEQREGRIIRRGNELYERDPENFEVAIFRYATEQTYDTRRWQILEHKARGIEQLRKYDGTLNEIDDIEGEAANSADMKAAASGDPLILEETQLRNEVRRLEALQASHADESQSMVRRARDQARFANEWGPRDLAKFEQLKKDADAHPVKKDEFAGLVVDGGKRIGDRDEAVKAIKRAMDGVLGTEEGGSATFTYRGIEFSLTGNASYAELESPTGQLDSFRMQTQPMPSAAGFLTRFANYVNRIPAYIDDLNAKIAEATKAAKELREQSGKPFAQAEELAAAREAHKRVQRRLIAKGPDIPATQRPLLEQAMEQQKKALREQGFDESLDEDAHFGARQRPATGTPTDRAVMDMLREGREAKDVLRLIAGTSKSRFNRQIARLLIRTGISPTMEALAADGLGKDKRGFNLLAKYSRAHNTVSLTEGAGYMAEQIVLHELIHAATLAALDRKGLHSLQMRRLFEHVKKHGGLAGTYGMKNVGEFTSEAFTNPDFQRELRKIKGVQDGGVIKTAWDSFVRILRLILGLRNDSTDALSQALQIGVAVMREDMQLRQRGVVARGGDAQAGIDQTQTEAFKRWFKDSKVVDAEGKALVVYHGTKGEFTKFDLERAGSKTDSGAWGRGIYFAADPEYAGAYAGRTEGSNIVPAYISLQNPLVVDARERTAAIRGIGLEVPRGDPTPAWSQQFANAVAQRGYDGVIVTLDGAPAEIVAFRPEQVKSATGNNGNFDPEDADIAHFGAAELARNMGEGLKSITRVDVRQAGRHKLTDWLKHGLQFLGRRQLVDIYGDVLPMREYDRLAAQMEADKNEAGAAADDLARRWGKLPDEGKLADLMHDATLAQIDADSDVAAAPDDDRAKATVLKARFKALTPEAQQVYRQARDSYSAHHARVREAIRARIMRSELGSAKREELLKRMDDDFFKKVKGVYFPLARFGKYVVAVKDVDGMVASVSRAETMAEAEALRQELLKAFPKDKGFAVGRVTLDKEFVANHQMVGRGFMTELYRALDGAGLDSAQLAELEDTLGQLYLSSLPDLSWAKHGIHRKGTPGFSQDARRAFAQNTFHGARYLAKLRYADLMQDELDRMQQHVDDWSAIEDFDQPSAQRVVDEMRLRHDAIMNPKSNPLSTALTSFGFIYYLGLSPAAAVVNLSQTALVAYPVMAGKWGYQKAGAALLRASKEAVAGKNDIRSQLKDDGEIAAYDAAVKAGVIDVTQSHDLAGIAQGEDSGVMWKMRPVMRAASFLFHHAERFNRQSTFIAAYRLARDTGAAHQDAYEQAAKATYDGHFDYASGNRPRIMQGNVARVVLLFKQFAQNMIYTLGRQAYLSVQGETPEVRRQARKVLAGLITTHAMGAGVLGLPLVGPLLAMASMLGGSDDEPWDAEVALRNMLAEAMGPTAAEVVAKGVSRLTPWDISGRIGLDKLIFPDVQEGLEGQRWAETFATGMLGPVVGIGVNVARAAQKMGDGDYGRALEDLLPVALRNPIKAVRFASEGAKDRTGVVIKDEVGSAGVLGQAIGFSPSEVRLAQEGKSAVMDADRRLNERRAQLLGQFAKAAMTQDAEGMREADAAIARFNEKNPGRRITAPQKWQSVRRREQRIREAENGVYLPHKRRDVMQAGAFALND